MSKKKRKPKPPPRKPCSATFHASVLQSIRQHARGSPNKEICGALIGHLSETGATIVGAVPGDGADQGGYHVTFTQEAWVRIHEAKDRKYAGQAIVGWYHSHPGFGVFLSDHDLFIHKNFFSIPGSVAWVYDPHSDEEGCFGWNGGEVLRIDRYSVITDAPSDIGSKREPSAPAARDRAHPETGLLSRIPPSMRRVLVEVGWIAALIALMALGFITLRRLGVLDRFRAWLNEPRQIEQPVDAGGVGVRVEPKASIGGRDGNDE